MAATDILSVSERASQIRQFLEEQILNTGEDRALYLGLLGCRQELSGITARRRLSGEDIEAFVANNLRPLLERHQIELTL